MSKTIQEDLVSIAGELAKFKRGAPVDKKKMEQEHRAFIEKMGPCGCFIEIHIPNSPSLIKKLKNVSHHQGVYGVLGLTKRANEILRISPSFNTFNEIWDDLSLLDESQWDVSNFEYELKRFDVLYRVVGNGFLELV